ncbi:DEAD/DEAH box helicase [Duodenibacillus massiliensis]|uniref:DEAD/DEAH box helicase n=1 Tax=Duodenibacillus massiliensis TaxID=1852381 RepID=UPI003AB380BF
MPQQQPAITSFSDFNLDSRIQTSIAAMGYVNPTPIQQKAIPAVLEGRDVMGAAQTGTGKTAGYGLPSLQRILPTANTSASPARHPVRMLVLAPTRELADQVNDNLKLYAANTPLRVGVVYGGVDIKPQSDQLRRGIEVLTATPGRLLDHIEGKAVNLSQVQIVILDEADRMLDMGFLPDISRILNHLPKNRQSLMFSATFSPEIKKLASNFLNDPVLIEVARRNATADTVHQVFYRVEDRQKTASLIEILKTQGEGATALKQVLVFVNAKITCRRLTRTLTQAGIKADSIHGDKTQEERTAALEAFKKGECEVLVATDVAARGLDIEELPVVINYDVPYVAEDYVHRIGRTGRAGAQGLAIMLITATDDRSVAAIEKLTKQTFKPVDYRPVERFRPRRDGDRNGYSDRPRREHCRDNDHEGRARPEYGTYRKAVYDPIFDKPYEPSNTPPRPIAATPVQPLRSTKKKAPVAALLGGRGR